MPGKEIVLLYRWAHGRNYRWTLLLAALAPLYLFALTHSFFSSEFLGLSAQGEGAVTTTSNDVRMFTGNWGLTILSLLIVPLTVLQARKRIVIDGRGIRLRSTLPSALAWFARDWSLTWSEIDRARLLANKLNPLASILVLESEKEKKRVMPWHWVGEDQPVEGMFRLKPPKPDKARAMLRETPLMRILEAVKPGFMEEDSTSGASQLTDATLATTTIAILFFLFIFYFITESFFTLSEYYVEGPPIALLAACGIAGGVGAFFALRRLEPQRKNSVIYAALFALGVGFAAYPFVGRINIWSDAEGLHEYAYVLTQDYVWHNRGSELPDLNLYLASSEWWRQFKPGDEYRFALRHGGLGLWQVNMDNIYAAQQEFYRCSGVIGCMGGSRR